MNGKYTLKCSFGTSKYCANFLNNAHCDSFFDGKCPFIHYLERRRHLVIEDDSDYPSSKLEKLVNRIVESLGHLKPTAE